MLSDLPLEILRRICTNLSPESALSFAHSCRHIYQACDDLTVWRNIVKGSARVRTDLPAAGLEPGRKGKRYTMADTSVSRPGDGSCRRAAVEQYMPQLMVLEYTMAAPLDLHTMYSQCQALVSRQEYPSSLVRAKTDNSKWFEFMTDPTSRFESKEWLSAQTASLCFAVGALSDAGYTYQSEEPFARLEDVQWFNSTANQRDCSDSLVMQHALANAAVGSFCLELRAALHGERTIGEDFEGTSNPPTASSIPLASQIATRLPSSPGSLNDSAPSCLMASMSPDFFTDHTWTGYVSTRGDWRSVYHGIGGHNLRDLPLGKGFDHMRTTNGPVAIDHTVRFRVIDTLANGDFILRSNYFHTRDDMYTLAMLVERRTGRLSICMSRPGDASPKALQTGSKNALNTPFGIVYGIEPGSWLWLWKSEWAAGNKNTH
ncbi:hypothetical protein BU25DRAFT_420123 [Macroventuria anomochaeta]|uniref:Uncharacterized protein n=1 Tax=Macroventuria anomochaeta TaxID=301207 RepID=A0ACB6S7Q9_9PLEO|nr:uncharacterized protein BU25DRAFT_420123 [Macroventuria anomochaeta]KAF2629244.1 hypothetical protein BU25DRAFT_420123 [Macroventuria anomochaeta]